MVSIKCQSRGLLTFIAPDNSIITFAVKKIIMWHFRLWFSPVIATISSWEDGTMRIGHNIVGTICIGNKPAIEPKTIMTKSSQYSTTKYGIFLTFTVDSSAVCQCCFMACTVKQQQKMPICSSSYSYQLLHLSRAGTISPSLYTTPSMIQPMPAVHAWRQSTEVGCTGSGQVQ